MYQKLNKTQNNEGNIAKSCLITFAGLQDGNFRSEILLSSYHFFAKFINQQRIFAVLRE